MQWWDLGVIKKKDKNDNFNICLENKKPTKLSIREHDLGVGTNLCSKLVNEGGAGVKISQNPVNVFCEWPIGAIHIRGVHKLR